MFIAIYPDADKTEKLARQNGWTPEGGSFFDFDLDPSECPTVAKKFTSFEAAKEWATAAINAEKTVFGSGEVLEIHEVPRHARCRYCTCRGEQKVRRWVLDGSDEYDEEIIESDCCN